MAEALRAEFSGGVDRHTARGCQALGKGSVNYGLSRADSPSSIGRVADKGGLASRENRHAELCSPKVELSGGGTEDAPSFLRAEVVSCNRLHE